MYIHTNFDGVHELTPVPLPACGLGKGDARKQTSTGTQADYHILNYSNVTFILPQQLSDSTSHRLENSQTREEQDGDKLEDMLDPQIMGGVHMEMGVIDMSGCIAS